MLGTLEAGGSVSAELADAPRLAGLVLREAGRRLRRRLRVGPLHRWRFACALPGAIAAVPTELRRGDPQIASDIYAGRICLAGRLVDTRGLSPFQISPPSREWSAELQSFEWLRHLGEAADALAGANARALVTDWIGHVGPAIGPVSHDADVAARRLVAWLVHSDLLLGEADPGFSRRFMKALTREIRYLKQTAPETADGLPRLRARIALCYGALCLPAGAAQVRLAAKNLSDELDRQVFADGVHVSRNPAAAIAILADLLPLARVFDAENQPVPKSLVNAVDRMLPMLRFFRHCDGAVALFNGAGITESALLTALLRFDETLGEPISHAPQGGYQRLSAARTILIADVGAPPPPAVSADAHAGTLAFEFSSGAARFVVNCGAPPAANPAMRRLARATAAHSTLTLADHSSSRFESAGAIERFLGAPLIAGPSQVPGRREDGGDGMRIVAAHDGYGARFGLVHERTLFLTRDGARIEGVDRLVGTPQAGRARRRTAATVRFHLHPLVAVERAGADVVLAARGQNWRFEADAPVEIEDSVFFADPTGGRRTHQLVVAFDPQMRSEVAWRFVRARQ